MKILIYKILTVLSVGLMMTSCGGRSLESQGLSSFESLLPLAEKFVLSGDDQAFVRHTYWEGVPKSQVVELKRLLSELKGLNDDGFDANVQVLSFEDYKVAEAKRREELPEFIRENLGKGFVWNHEPDKVIKYSFGTEDLKQSITLGASEIDGLWYFVVNHKQKD